MTLLKVLKFVIYYITFKLHNIKAWKTFLISMIDINNMKRNKLVFYQTNLPTKDHYNIAAIYSATL